MKNHKSVRFLPILIVVLILLTQSLTAYLLLFRRTADDRKFDETMQAVEAAVLENRNLRAGWEMLQASRHAVTVMQWKQLLRSAALQLPEDAQYKNYRLLERLAYRAKNVLPDNQDVTAFLVWTQLRSGRIKKAEKTAVNLSGNVWPTLLAELKILAYLDEEDLEMEDFYRRIESDLNAEFLEEVAEITQSAVLTVDAALARMRDGETDRALELAKESISGNRWWKNLEFPFHHNLYSALGRLAYDARDTESAVTWLNTGIQDGRSRRMVYWKDLQFLGDIYWKQYRLQGRSDYRNQARKLWYEALRIVYPDLTASIPENSWKLWINLSILESTEGNNRQSEVLLRDALTIFPDQSEVKSAWAVKNADDNPGLASRLLRSDPNQPTDYVSAIAALKVDPTSLPPHLYEAGLWELFNEITIEKSTVQPVDIRTLTTFLLEYLSIRKDFSSIDIVVDRYRKYFPDETWILSWRLASDASRYTAIIDLIPAQAGELAVYNEFREFVRREKSWRGLHDTALYALMASQELISIADGFIEKPTHIDRSLHDPLLIYSLRNEFRTLGKDNLPLEDRVQALIQARSDTEKLVKSIGAGGRKGREYRSIGKATLIEEIDSLYLNSLDDLQMALSIPMIAADKKVRLYYLQAFVFRYLGQFDKMKGVIEAALAIDPANPKLQELYGNEVIQ